MWNSIIMIKVQHIVFNNSLDFKIQQGGIVEQGVEILYIYFADNCDSNSLCLVGRQLEWKPEIWIDLEKEKLQKVKEINIVSLRGDLSKFSKHISNTFKNTEVKHHAFPLHMQKGLITSVLETKSNLPVVENRTKSVYSSIGMMRLNRYILVKESIDKGYDNIFYPAISQQQSRDYEYQIRQCNGVLSGPITLEAKRLFDKPMSLQEFNGKQIKHLSQSYVNIVASFPNSNWIQYGNCEKFFNSIMCKTVPFMLCEKDSNTAGLQNLGFLPYVGFELANDGIIDYVHRWQGLLHDNSHIFSDKTNAFEVYNKNLGIIKHNFDHLTKTDWASAKDQQFNNMPRAVQEYLSARPIWSN